MQCGASSPASRQPIVPQSCSDSRATSSPTRQSDDCGNRDQDQGIVPDARKAFFRSLALKGHKDQSEAVNAPEIPQNQGPETVVCEFSLEGLLQFQDDHVEHASHHLAPKTAPARPNYDNRKRRFFAIQPVERKKHLNLLK